MSMVSESEMDDTQEPFAPYTVLPRTAACIGGILVFFFFLFFLLISSQALSSRASYGPRALSLSLPLSLSSLFPSAWICWPVSCLQANGWVPSSGKEEEKRKRKKKKTRGLLRRRNYPVGKRDMRIAGGSME